MKMVKSFIEKMKDTFKGKAKEKVLHRWNEGQNTRKWRGTVFHRNNERKGY